MSTKTTISMRVISIQNKVMVMILNDQDQGGVKTCLVTSTFLCLSISKSAYVSRSMNTVSLWRESAVDNILTKTVNFLKLPVLCVISSISARIAKEVPVRDQFLGVKGIDMLR